MAKPRIVLNQKQLRAVLRSSEVQRDLLARAKRIAAVAGPGFEVESSMSYKRAFVDVIAATPEAERAEAKHGVLTKSLDAGRG